MDYGTELQATYDFLLKFIVIGSSGVGKSCFVHRYLNKDFKSSSQHTIGVEFNSALIKLPSSSPSSSSRSPQRTRTLKCQLWDTAGQERFRSVTRNYYRGACGAVLVYDITSRASFQGLPSWLTDARTLASPDLIVVLVGNKVDNEVDREVGYLEASNWARENDCLFLEASSLTGDNVDQAFNLLARTILAAIESGKIDPEKSGSGVSYGERALRRVSSWGSSLKSNGSRKGLLGKSGKCC